MQTSDAETAAALLAALRQIVGDVSSLMDHSMGVVGLAFSGGVTPWRDIANSDLLRISAAQAAIAKAEGAL